MTSSKEIFPNDVGETALAVRDDNYGLERTAFEPRSIEEAMVFAGTTVKSGLCNQIRSAEQAFVVMATGRELGLGALASLRTIVPIPQKGGGTTLAILMQAQIALVRRQSNCRYFRLKHDPRKPGLSKEDQEYAVWESLKRGDDERVEQGYFTMLDAKQAGYLGGIEYTDDRGNRQTTKPKDNWRNDPRSMLVWRAAGRLIRQEWSHVLLGIYAPDELEDLDNGPVIDVPSPAPRQPSKPIIDRDAPLMDRMRTANRVLAEILQTIDAETFREIVGVAPDKLESLDQKEWAIQACTTSISEKKAAQPAEAKADLPSPQPLPREAAPPTNSPTNTQAEAPKATDAQQPGPSANQAPEAAPKTTADGAAEATSAPSQAPATSGGHPPEYEAPVSMQEIFQTARACGLSGELVAISKDLFGRAPDKLTNVEKHELMDALQARGVLKQARQVGAKAEQEMQDREAARGGNRGGK